MVKANWTENLFYNEIVSYLPDLINAHSDEKKIFKLSTNKGGYLITTSAKDKIIVVHSDDYPGLHIKEISKTLLSRVLPFRPLNFLKKTLDNDILAKIDCEKGTHVFNFLINNKLKTARILNEALLGSHDLVFVKTSEEKLLKYLEELNLSDTFRTP